MVSIAGKAARPLPDRREIMIATDFAFAGRSACRIPLCKVRVSTFRSRECSAAGW
jgi:hypothetical protein